MHSRRPVPPQLAALAARQGGVLTRRQALEHLGHAPLRRLVSSGAWHVPVAGIVACSERLGPLGRLWIGPLLGGPGSALGGWAALSRTGVVDVPERVSTWVPPGRRRVGARGWTFPQDGNGRLTERRGTLPAIRPEEALLDVAASCTLETWVGVLSDLVRESRVAPIEVKRRAGQRSRLANRAMVTAVLDDIGGIESTLEWVYRRDVERAHGLPRGTRQVSDLGPWRNDVRYEGCRLAVELDGRHHVRRVLRDLHRDNAHVLRGIDTLRYGSIDVRTRPCEVARQVARALTDRGWRGDLRRCPRCP